MANYYGCARTNYFNVKDEPAFLEAMTMLPDIEVIRNSDGQVGLMDVGDSGCFPSWLMNPDDPMADGEEIDIAEYVAAHLADGAVAIFMAAGHEKMRYVAGYAEAINSKFQKKFLSLDNIYDMAAGLTTSMKVITRAEY